MPSFLIGLDTVQTGRWQGTHGRDGWSIAIGIVSLPAYLTSIVWNNSGSAYGQITDNTNPAWPYCMDIPGVDPAVQRSPVIYSFSTSPTGVVITPNDTAWHMASMYFYLASRTFAITVNGVDYLINADKGVFARIAYQGTTTINMVKTSVASSICEGMLFDPYPANLVGLNGLTGRAIA